MSSLRFSLILLFLFPFLSQAAITLPDILADHMVVQRDKEIPVWGAASPGAKITVEMAGKSATATADKQGAWSVKLPALPAGGPCDLKISGDGELTLTDILAGDVWLSSGQSNLTFRMVPNLPWSEGVLDYEKEVAAANNPKLRFFTVTVGTSHQPEKEIYGLWQTTTPEDVRFISAVSYYFAKAIQEQTGIPIGIIVSGRGGTSIKSWMPREDLEKFPELAPVLATADKRLSQSAEAIKANEPKLQEYRKKYRQALLTTGKIPPSSEPYPHYDTAPGALYNAMIAPLARVPIRGFIYYQGESDSPEASAYAGYFKALIASRRALWGIPDAPFLFVQIANFDIAKARNADPAKYGDQWARQRAAQARALELPHTAMAVAADVGDELKVHPRDKKTVGDRLARAAMHLAYGKDLPYRGPRLQNAGKLNNTVTLAFQVEQGALVGKQGNDLAGFELAGADGVFHPARATLDADKVAVSSRDVPDPQTLRYAWANNPTLSLYDTNGLPCPPFEKKLGAQ